MGSQGDVDRAFRASGWYLPIRSIAPARSAEGLASRQGEANTRTQRTRLDSGASDPSGPRRSGARRGLVRLGNEEQHCEPPGVRQSQLFVSRQERRTRELQARWREVNPSSVARLRSRASRHSHTR
ncbi:MAG: hypothetical protein M3081_21785 [Gemmatimonadota bacterium]|nr:hypothetical protein [Gemmatimonadota bacterium]